MFNERSNNNMLKKIRVIIAAFFIAAITLLFLDYTGTIHACLGWCAKIQLVPAAFAAFPSFLAVNVAIIAGLLLITFLFGRVYCSALCPLGIFQDIVSRLAGIGRKNRFSHRPPCKKQIAVRYTIYGIFTVTAIAHIGFVVALLEPYSAYGRMVSQILGPVYQWGNNILAGFAERSGSYAFYTVDVWVKGAGALAVAVLTLAVVAAFAWKSGRGYCNTICPAGAILGLIAKFSLMKPRINKEKCTSCGLCAKNCKASCVDSANKKIDYLRCVSCFNCIGCCPNGGIAYSAGGTAVSSNTKGVSK